MHGDLSRFRFDASKRYSSVRFQQGRLVLDADQNEQTEILLRDVRGAREDLIGETGTPEHAPGFGLSVSGAALRVSNGRYYVNGVRVELGGAPIDLTAQPFLPGATLPAAQGFYVAYLDVWERPVTAVQDPALREVALGGPDTSTRTEVVWQVRLLKVNAASTPSCATVFPEWDRLLAGSTGTLEVREAQGRTSNEPCVVPETAGYRGLENQLYRLQIHAGNFDPTAGSGSNGTQPTFKWSRDNGAIVASWREHPSSLQVTVDRLGPGGAAGFDPGQWVELSNDQDDYLERAGVLAQIDDVVGSTLVLRDPDGSVATGLSPVPRSSAALHSQARRWDSQGARSTVVGGGEINTSIATADGWFRIDRGLEARFSAGSFRPGDFWVVPARTAVLPESQQQRIDWPTDLLGTPLALRAHGNTHHFAKLAILQRTAGGWVVVTDCRRRFAALTDQIALFSRGGDGQHARSGHWLPAPLRVGVMRGRFAAPNLRVRFLTVTEAGAPTAGNLSATTPSEDGVVASSGPTIDVVSDALGQAAVYWRLGNAPAPEERGDTYLPARAQHVEAVLLDAGGNEVGPRTRFSASALDNLGLVAAGGDGQIGRPGATLPIALRARVSDGSLPVAAAHVEFVVMNQVFNGAPLDENRGGSVHASDVATRVRFVAWPGGTRMQSAVVATDSDGVAQVQWIVGTERGLPAQRVMAYLLDDAGVRTAQAILFTAHLAMASEIDWVPCPDLAEHAATEELRTTQAALDLYCRIIEPGVQRTLIRRLQYLNSASEATDLTPDSEVPAEALRTVRMQVKGPVLFPVQRSRIRYFQRAITMRFENTFDNRELEFIKVPGTVALSSPPGPTAQLDFTVNPQTWSSITQLISRYGISRYHRVEVSFNPAFAYGGDFWGHDVRATTSFWVYAQAYGYYLSRGIGTALL